VTTPVRLYTVGHGARSAEDFVGLLASSEVQRLVDVRTAPGSRRHPQFGRDALAASLSRAGIEYAWRKDLGGFRRPRPDSPHTALRGDGFRGYADYMDSAAFTEALAWLVETSRGRVTSIMCAESLWWRCHRRMIADALTAAGHDVRHLLGAGPESRSVGEHRLHPAARLEGGRVVYDVEEPEQPQQTTLDEP
jgi:uncharacterized protein (DUF488 family)